MKRIAVISAVLDEPDLCQQQFNEVVAGFKHIVRGRMGIPFEEGGFRHQHYRSGRNGRDQRFHRKARHHSPCYGQDRYLEKGIVGERITHS